MDRKLKTINQNTNMTNLNFKENWFTIILIVLVAISCGLLIGKFLGLKDSGPIPQEQTNTPEQKKLLPKRPQTTYLNVSEEDILFPKVGGTKNLSITTDGAELHVSNCPDWLTYSLNGNELSLHCDKNSTLNERSGYVVIESGDMASSVFVKQSQWATRLEISTTNLKVPSSGGTYRINVNTDADDYKVEFWEPCSIEKHTDYFTITMKENTGYGRDFFVFVNVATNLNLKKTINIHQKGKCRSCGGSGRVKCSNAFCQFGHYQEYNAFTGRNEFVTCPTCGGSGSLECPICHGSGKEQ